MILDVCRRLGSLRSTVNLVFCYHSVMTFSIKFTHRLGQEFDLTDVFNKCHSMPDWQHALSLIGSSFTCDKIEAD